jgi:hypothetical protein
MEFLIECIKYTTLRYKDLVPLGKNIVKGATQVSGYSLKLHFFVFEKSQGKHNNLDCYKCFWNIFH